jgi:polysaccharide biosynthesis/export protein
MLAEPMLDLRPFLQTPYAHPRKQRRLLTVALLLAGGLSVLGQGGWSKSALAQEADLPFIRPNVQQPSVQQPGVQQPGMQPTAQPTLPSNGAVGAPSAASGALSNGYLLDSGDQLYLQVFGVEEYAGEFTVLADGSVRLPLVGQVPVRGVTLEQAQMAVTQAYGEYIRQPFVDLNLIATRPVQIAIAGEVNRPGAYALEAAEANQPITVSKAIQLAGGITQMANIRQVQVVRGQGVPGMVPQAADVDLWELIQSGDLGQDLVLRDGDTVVIPTATTVNAAEATRVASANFSPESITVYLVGEVETPGAIELQPNVPLNQALLAAGGFTNRAVDLVRLNPNGTVSKNEIKIDFAQSVDEQNNPVLQDNDTIVVSETGLSRFSDRADQITSPVLGILNFLRFLF